MSSMRVLIACEYSAIVRDAFRARGHDAWSCDRDPTEGDPAYHIQGCVLQILNDGWDLMIAHPPCTRMANSSVKHLYIGCREENGIDPEKWEELEEGAEFFNKLGKAPIGKIARENPVMHEHAIKLTGGKADQYVQPWWFGSKKNKATGFRLKGLPKLVKTNVVGPMPKTVLKGTPEYRSWNECWYMSPGPDRGKKRARTNLAVAKAMAEQWGGTDGQ